MLLQYGDTCTGQRKVYEWVERFKNGRTYVTVEDRSGRPVTLSIVLERHIEHGQTVNSESYSTMLKDKLKPAIRSKRR
jgi:uncharacterized protein YerC